MKKILLMLTLVFTGLCSWAQGELIPLHVLDYTQPVTKAEELLNDKGVNDYTSTFTADNGFWTIYAFNNNNNAKDKKLPSGTNLWQEIRAGKKSGKEDEHPYIYTKKCSEAVDVITLTIGKNYNEKHLNGLSIESASDPDFTKDVATQDFLDEFKKQAKDGKLITLELRGHNPEARFYKINFTIKNTTTSNGSFSLSKIGLYQKPATLDFIQDEYSVNMDELFPAPFLHNPNNCVIDNYTSSNEAVATVDATTGIVQLLDYGTTIITATCETGEYASYTLNVVKKNPDIHFHEVEYSVDVRSFPATPILPTLVNPNELDLSTVEFASSDETVATVNNATGEVTVLSHGVTEISATFSGHKDFVDQTATYTLYIVNNDNLDETFDFVNNDYGFSRDEMGWIDTDIVLAQQGLVTINYSRKENTNYGIAFKEAGLYVSYFNKNTPTPDHTFNITVPLDFYITEIVTSCAEAMEIGFDDQDYTKSTSHKFTNSDPSVNSVNLISYSTDNICIASIDVKIAPIPITMTPGGFFNEPIEVLVSGDEKSKTANIYYADGEEKVINNVKNFTLDRSATVEVVNNSGFSATETYVITREIVAEGLMMVDFNEDAQAYYVYGEISSIVDNTPEENGIGYVDLKPDGHVLYVNGVEIGECSEGATFELENILPNAKIEVMTVKEGLERKIIVTDISSQIEWEMGDLAEIENLKMELVSGDGHIVEHSVVENVPYVHTALRMCLQEGNVKALLDKPYEFVIHNAKHSQGYFTLWNYKPLDDENDNYEIHYIVDHVGNPNHTTIDDFYKSSDATTSVEATIGFRFIVEQPSSPNAIIRRAPGSSVPTEVYYDENNRSEVPSFTFAADNSGMSGIEDVAVDATEAVEYFNLQGIRLGSEPASGLYIRRQGGIATKVVR